MHLQAEVIMMCLYGRFFGNFCSVLKMKGPKVFCMDGLHDVVNMGSDKKWKLVLIHSMNRDWDSKHNDGPASPVPLSALLTQEESAK